MIQISNRESARVAYIILLDRKLRGLGDTEHIQNLKRKLRQWTREDEGDEYRDVCIVKDYGIDGYIELVQLGAFDSKDEAEEFFDDYIRIVPRPSMYDCTGQAFTCWAKIFQRRGEWWAYHSVGFDV